MAARVPDSHIARLPARWSPGSPIPPWPRESRTLTSLAFRLAGVQDRPSLHGRASPGLSHRSPPLKLLGNERGVDDLVPRPSARGTRSRLADDDGDDEDDDREEACAAPVLDQLRLRAAACSSASRRSRSAEGVPSVPFGSPSRFRLGGQAKGRASLARQLRRGDRAPCNRASARR
jgi:hypothetical protein